MKVIPALLLLVFSSLFIDTAAQDVKKIDKVEFFREEAPLQATIVMNMNKLLSKKLKEGLVFPAEFKCILSEGTVVAEKIQIEVRGKFRRENCYIPPLKVKFNNPTSPVLSPLKSLKLVNACKNTAANDDYILREYMVYRIYNVLTDMSFRVRLLKLTYVDSASKKVFTTKHSFLIEDIDDLAKRNKCVEAKRWVTHTELTNRPQNTLMTIFQYMIGNTDWSIPVKHNIKLIVPKTDTTLHPYPVPYDFDHAGLVYTDYALPNPVLPIQSIKERLYRGFPRTYDELELAVDVFNKKKKSILQLISNFELLPLRERKDMINFLQTFYSIVMDPNQIKSEFIRNARNN